MTFRTRADSPTPKLVTAPVAAVPQTPAPCAPASGAGRGNGRRASGGLHQNPGMNLAFAANYQSTMGSAMPSSASSTAQTTMATPAPTPSMSATGSGAYNANSTNSNAGRNNDRAATRNFSSGINGTNGTYSFSGLGSPFAPNAANMAGNTMNPIVSAFTEVNSAVLTPNANNLFSIGSANPAGQNMMSPHEAWPFLHFQTAQQSFNQMNGDFANANANAAQSFLPSDNGVAGLGINHGMPYFQGASMMSAQDMSHSLYTPLPTSMPTSMPMTTSTSMPAMLTATGHAENQTGDRRPSAPIYSNAKIIANVMRKHSPLNRNILDASVAPQEKLSPITSDSKRKRTSVEVEFNPPKRAMLAPSPEQSGTDVQVLAAMHPAGSPSAQASEKATKPRRKKMASPSISSPQVATSVPEGAPLPSQSVSIVSPSVFDSPSAASGYTLGPAEIWHNGMHANCRVNGRHRHDGTNGLCFEALEDYEKAAAFSNASSAAAAVPQMDPVPVVVNHGAAKVFDLVSRGADIDMATVVHLQVPAQDPAQAQQTQAQQALHSAPAQDPAQAQAQAQVQFQQTQAEPQTQVEIQVPAPKESSNEAATVAVPDVIPDVDLEGSKEVGDAGPTAEYMLLTYVSASLREEDKVPETAAIPVPTENLASSSQAASSTQAVPTGSFSGQVLPTAAQDMASSEKATGAPSFGHRIFSGGATDYESFGMDDDSSNIIDAYFNGDLADCSVNNDFFNMIDETQL